MTEHKCVIGLLHYIDYSDIVTLDDLKNHINNNIEFNKSIDADSMLRNDKNIRVKCWTLNDYGDRRKNTNLSRFDYCPQCGKRIDWKSIRKVELVL